MSIQPILHIEPSRLQAYRPITTYECGHQPTETYIFRGYLQGPIVPMYDYEGTFLIPDV